MTKTTVHGVSSLAIALMGNPRSDSAAMMDKRHEFIEYLIKDLKINVNTMNMYSFWTPLHWACLYGDKQVVEMLIQKEVNAFTPTNLGLFPIDIAGYFGHGEIVESLIKYSIRCYQNDQYANPIEEIAINNSSISPELLLSYLRNCLVGPIYATTLLFWAARFSNVTLGDFEFILNKMESYPEAILEVASQQTPLHAACYSKDAKKLKLMLTDF